MRRSGSSRELAIAACRAAQQEPRVPRVEFRMKKMTRALRLALCAPGPRRNVGSCPAAKFARGPEIRAMQCACCNRGKGRVRGAPWLAGESRTSTRAWQAYSPAPKRRRAHARDVLSTAYRHPERPPVAQSCARGMGRMTMRSSRRCFERPRRTVPTHCVNPCIKVGPRTPPTRRRRAVLPLTGAVARGGPWARRSQLIYLAPSLVIVSTARSHR